MDHIFRVTVSDRSFLSDWFHRTWANATFQKQVHRRAWGEVLVSQRICHHKGKHEGQRCSVRQGYIETVPSAEVNERTKDL